MLLVAQEISWLCVDNVGKRLRAEAGADPSLAAAEISVRSARLVDPIDEGILRSACGG